MTAATYLTKAVVKPVASGVAAGLLDHFILNNVNVKDSLYFGGAVTAGIFSVSWIEPIVVKYLPTSTPIGMASATLEGRIIEVTLACGSSYALNSYVLKNQYSNTDYMYRVGIIALADIIGESVCEFALIV